MEEIVENAKRVLRTRAFGGKDDRAELKRKRKSRIQEAISWESGSSLDEQEKHVVGRLPDNTEVYFLKPGKEAFRSAGANPHDMTISVGESYVNARFEDVWVHLSRISTVSFELFRMVLVLVYRSAYLLDHEEIDAGIRYLPRKPVANLIDEIDESSVDVLPRGGLPGLLNFLDMLGWNEDVKYHTEEGLPTFSGEHKFDTGRINTLLSSIRVTYQMSIFVEGVLNEATHPDNVDFRPAFKLMQQFASSRGTCKPTKANLLEWLSPYLRRRDESLNDF